MRGGHCDVGEPARGVITLIFTSNAVTHSVETSSGIPALGLTVRLRTQVLTPAAINRQVVGTLRLAHTTHKNSRVFKY